MHCGRPHLAALFFTLQYLSHLFEVINFLQSSDDGLNVLSVVHSKLYLSAEDTLVSRECNLMNVDIHPV